MVIIRFFMFCVSFVFCKGLGLFFVFFMGCLNLIFMCGLLGVWVLKEGSSEWKNIDKGLCFFL